MAQALRGSREPRVDCLEAPSNPQMLRFLGIAFGKLPEFRAKESQSLIELMLAGFRSAGNAHRTIDTRLGLWPAISRVDRAPQLSPSDGRDGQAPVA